MAIVVTPVMTTAITIMAVMMLRTAVHMTTVTTTRVVVMIFVSSWNGWLTMPQTTKEKLSTTY